MNGAPERTIKLLTTGGTIATGRDADGTTRPMLNAQELLGRIVDHGDSADVSINAEQIAQRPSWSLDASDMDAIALAAVRAAHDEQFVGVVVTHGTTTLEYSAFLTDLRYDGPAPIVFTGAMRRADADEPDGPPNLRDAVAVAADPSTVGCGVLIVMAGRILSAREAWKSHRTDVDSFVGLDGGLGRIDGGNVHLDRMPRRTRSFTADLEPRVAIVKAYPGAGRASIDAVVATGCRGVVVEGLPGSGGVPEGMQAALRDAVTNGCSVVLASRAPYGRVPPEPTGGTGEPLAGMGLISAGGLTAEKAWVLLMLSLGEATDSSQVREIFAGVAEV